MVPNMLLLLVIAGIVLVIRRRQRRKQPEAAQPPQPQEAASGMWSSVRSEYGPVSAIMAGNDSSRRADLDESVYEQVNDVLAM